MVTKLIFLAFVLVFANSVDSSRILGIFHYPSKSHHILGRALMRGLLQRGHEVTMVSPFSDKETPENYTHVQLTGIVKNDDVMKNWAKTSMWKMVQVAKESMKTMGKSVLAGPEIQQLLNSNQTFDAVILFWGFSEAMLGIGDHFKAPVIAYSSIGGNFFAMVQSGNPTPYSYVPHMFLGYSDKMTFLERVINTIVNVATDVVHAFMVLPIQEEIYNEVFPNGRPLNQLLKELNVHLVNSHYSSETIRPYLPNVIQIGGYHLHETESLPENLKKYLDRATEGVILVSFGTNLKPSFFSKDDKEAIVRTLAKQSMKVLWKFEEDIPEKSKNVRIEKWIPQKAVLLHPNVKLFISHGGMGSVAESMYAGVPLVGIPFFGDQDSNVAKAVKDGIAVKVLSTNITEENLSNAVEELLTNPRYKERVQLISSLYKDQVISPMDNAAYWVNHVIKHKGASHLRSTASDLSLYQYYLLDVIAFLAAIVLAFLLFIYFLIKITLRLACKIIFKKKDQVKKKTQ